MRNQLLRDADWAGMRHSLEIRVPLVDAHLTKRIAPLMPVMPKGAGKRALGMAPSSPLPSSVLNRDKTGFGVPTMSWMEGALAEPIVGPASDRKGGISRNWASFVIEATAASPPYMVS